MSPFQSRFASFKAGLRALLPPPPLNRGTLPLELAAARILPKVRPRVAYETFGLGNPGRRPESRMLAGGFSHSLVLDFPEGEIEVTSAHLRAWGRDFDEMLCQARINLLARGGEERFECSPHGFFRSTWGDGLDGSRILLPGMLRQLPLAGDPVVLMPCKDVLLVAGSEDSRALERALEGALALQGASVQPMNSCPLRLNFPRWVPLTLPPGHAAQALLAKAEHHRLHQEYGRQKHPVDHQARQEGRKVEGAPFDVVAGPSGGSTSAAHWTGDLLGGLLPEAGWRS